MTATPLNRSSEPGAAHPAGSAEVDLRAVQVFFGTASETECRIYAQCESARSRSDSKLTGSLRGPECSLAHTLPVTFPFRQVGGADSRPVDATLAASTLAEAWVPDPCFWTPAMPYLYRYELRWDGSAAAKPPTSGTSSSGIFGIRRLGVSGGNLILDRRRWVLRGAYADKLDEEELFAWHAEALAAIVRRPADALCEAASRIGVLLVADLTGCAGELLVELRRLRRWPAVGIVIVDGHRADVKLSSDTALPDELRRTARNILFAERFAPGEPIAPSSWAQIAFCEAQDDDALTEHARGCLLPVVAVRPAFGRLGPSEIRAECDRLQRDLAPTGLNLAGYVV